MSFLGTEPSSSGVQYILYSLSHLFSYKVLSLAFHEIRYNCLIVVTALQMLKDNGNRTLHKKISPSQKGKCYIFCHVKSRNKTELEWNLKYWEEKNQILEDEEIKMKDEYDSHTYVHVWNYCNDIPYYIQLNFVCFIFHFFKGFFSFPLSGLLSSL